MCGRGMTKNILSFLARVVLSFALLFWLFKKIDIGKMINVLKTADLMYVGVALCVFLLINLILLIRWFVFIKALDLEVTFMDVVRNFFIGLFCNLFLPSAIGGDIVKTFGLCRTSSQKARVVASVILDRLSGFASIVLVATVAFIFGYRFINDPSLLWLIGAIALFSTTIFIILLNEKLFSFVCRVFNGVPKIKDGLMSLHNDLVMIKDRQRAIMNAVGLSCLSQVVLAAVFFLIARALHHPVDIIYFFIFSPLVCVAASLPSIGGLGVREVGWVYLLAKVGVPESISLSMSLMSFLFMVIVGLIGGLIYVVTVSSGRVQCYQPGSAVGAKKA